MKLLLTSVEQGLIFGILAMGVFITYKILDMADLSVEGTFPFGAFLFAKFISLGINPILSTLLACLFGSLAGLLTTLLFTQLKIRPILAGILTMTILYSVNLKINGRSNIPLFDYDSVFDLGSTLLVLIIIALLVKVLLDLFLKTETGYLLIATGDNEALVKSLGENCNKYKLIGLMIANGLVALSGALMAQHQGFVDITMGASIIVVALASIIIGDTIKKKSSLLKSTTRVIIGAIIYKIIGGIAIDLGLNPDDLKAVNAFIVIAFIAYNNVALDLFKFNGKGGGVKNVTNTQPVQELQQRY
ncbi:MAG: ABC transporter permease [Tissierellia bacterium]|nr:ABC transporter permease [Tissierellia bacterium]